MEALPKPDAWYPWRRHETPEAIQGLKQQREDWAHLAARVNRELKPQLEATQTELLSLIQKYDTSLDLSQIHLALCRRPKPKPNWHMSDDVKMGVSRAG